MMKSSNFKVFLSLLVIVCSAMVHEIDCLPPNALPSQEGIAGLIFKSSIASRDPMASMACFADYIASSNEISENYSKNYKNCLVNATEVRHKIDEEAAAERKVIASRASSICMSINVCNQINNSLHMLSCHANLGSNNTKSTYLISGNAAEYVRELEEKYRSVDIDYEACCHAAERYYVEDTAQNYNRLQNCLDGRATPRPPTTTTTQTTPMTTKSSTTTTSTTTTTTPTTTHASTTQKSTEAPGGGTGEPLETTESPQILQEQFAKLLNLLN